MLPRPARLFPLLFGALLLAWLLPAAAARAEIAVGYTPEWLTQESALVAVVTPEGMERSRGPGDVWFLRMQLRIEETIKGSEGAGDLVTVYDFVYDAAEAEAALLRVRPMQRMLVFARRAEKVFPEIEGRYVAAGMNQTRSVFLAGRPIEGLYTADFRAIEDFPELLRHCREHQAKLSELESRGWKGSVRKKSLEVPGDSEAFRELWAGSACYLWLPEFVER